jgi:tRNA dimethylallyltransferase
MNEGLLDEAKKVHPQKDLNALQTVGYKELFSYFDNEISLEFAIEEIKKNTRRFAKRQLTWFKRNPETKWFEYNANKEEIVEFINNKI